MIIDSRITFDTAHAYSSSGASTDYLDLGSARDIGPGEDIEWVVVVDVAADAGTGDETYTYALQTDDNSSFSSATTLATITIPRGAAAGTKYSLCVPYGTERYIRTYATLGGTTPSVTLSSHFGDDAPVTTTYPDAI